MIELDNICLRYNKNYLFESLNVSVPAGGNLLITGNSGVGKTSMLRLILGLIQPQHGSVIINRQPISKENIWTLRGMMAYVSQDISLGQGSVEDFIREIFRFRRNRVLKYDRSETVLLLQHFDLADEIMTSRLEDLSGGELQRIAIITALLLKRPIYLLDEITSALDRQMKEKVIKYFLELKNTTLVVVSHDSVWHQQGFQTLQL